MRPWIRKRDSKGAYYLIINDLRLTDKDFRKKICKKPLVVIPMFPGNCLNGRYENKTNATIILTSIKFIYSSECFDEQVI